MNVEEMMQYVNELRFLVFMECKGDDACEEQDTHHFHQVLLSADQFKAVTDIASNLEPPDDSLKPGYVLRSMNLSGEIYKPDMFEGLESIYKNKKII